MNPSGEQHEIAAGGRRAVVTEVGATLRCFSVDGREVIEGFGEEEMASGGRGQLLLPWPNRIRDGAYVWNGKRQQLPLSEVERRNASHGLVRWSSWRLVDHLADRVRLALAIHPQPGYPFLIDLEAEYALAEALSVTVTATNRGDGPAPFGCGSHPYLKAAGKTIDEGLLKIPARTYLEVDDRLLPTGRRLPVEGTDYDFRRPRPLGETQIDTCFADFDEPRIEFDGHTIEWGGSFGFAQLYTGDGLAAERRRTGLAVEPMSCPADAFNSTEGLVTLGPGATWSGSWSIR